MKLGTTLDLYSILLSCGNGDIDEGCSELVIVCFPYFLRMAVGDPIPRLEQIPTPAEAWGPTLLELTSKLYTDDCRRYL